MEIFVNMKRWSHLASSATGGASATTPGTRFWRKDSFPLLSRVWVCLGAHDFFSLLRTFVKYCLLWQQIKHINISRKTKFIPAITVEFSCFIIADLVVFTISIIAWSYFVSPSEIMSSSCFIIIWLLFTRLPHTNSSSETFIAFVICKRIGRLTFVPAFLICDIFEGSTPDSCIIYD